MILVRQAVREGRRLAWRRALRVGLVRVPVLPEEVLKGGGGLLLRRFLFFLGLGSRLGGVAEEVLKGVHLGRLRGRGRDGRRRRRELGLSDGGRLGTGFGGRRGGGRRHDGSGRGGGALDGWGSRRRRSRHRSRLGSGHGRRGGLLRKVLGDPSRSRRPARRGGRGRLGCGGRFGGLRRLLLLLLSLLAEEILERVRFFLRLLLGGGRGLGRRF